MQPANGRTSRMSADERRAQILAAATRAFGRGGYAGTSTDTVAKEAGVSQPYVVRMFGTKRDLFLEVFQGAVDRIKGGFSAVLDEGDFDPEGEADWTRMGAAYTELLADHDFLQVLLHGFAAGGDEQIGAVARTGMAEIYGILRSTGCAPERATGFIAHGMLLNVMMAMEAPQHAADHELLADLTRCAFGDEGMLRVCSGQAEGSARSNL